MLERLRQRFSGNPRVGVVLVVVTVFSSLWRAVELAGDVQFLVTSWDDGGQRIVTVIGDR